MTLLLAIAVGQASAQTLASSDPVAVVPSADKLPEPLVQLGGGEYFSSHALLMDKSTRTLSIWKFTDGQMSLVTAVAADFGRNGGAKSSAGDYKTPEGIYFFQEMKEGAGLNFEEYGDRAFTLDYPNFFDGLSQKSGNGIWLHAIPDTKSLLRGSRGCVVVRNEVIKAISPYITLKRTPIIIADKVTYLDKAGATNSRQSWQSWLDKWRNSWQSKNINEYMSFYGDGFKSLGMDKEEWKEYKTTLAETYKFIKVNLSEPVVLHHGSEMVVRFIQDYSSDKNADFGEKTLYLKQVGNNFQIIGEEWKPVRRSSTVAKDNSISPTSAN